MFGSSTRAVQVLAGLAGAILSLTALAACAESSSGPSASNPAVNVALTDNGCNPSRINISAGKTTFVVSNPRSSRVDSFTITDGDRVVLSVTNVIGGLSRSASVDLEHGSYTLRCVRGEIGGEGTLVVTE